MNNGRERKKERTVCFVVSFTPGGRLHGFRGRQTRGIVKSKTMERTERRKRRGLSLRWRGEPPTRRGLGSSPKARISDGESFRIRRSTRERSDNHFYRIRSGLRINCTGVTVATINNSRNSGGSVATSFCLFYPFLSDQWTMMMMTRETEGPSGRSDHDQMT